MFFFQAHVTVIIIKVSINSNMEIKVTAIEYRVYFNCYLSCFLSISSRSELVHSLASRPTGMDQVESKTSYNILPSSIGDYRFGCYSNGC